MGSGPSAESRASDGDENDRFGHAIALAWWIKQAAKPVARGSGNPYLLKKKS